MLPTGNIQFSVSERILSIHSVVAYFSLRLKLDSQLAARLTPRNRLVVFKLVIVIRRSLDHHEVVNRLTGLLHHANSLLVGDKAWGEFDKLVCRKIVLITVPALVVLSSDLTRTNCHVY